MLKSFILAGIFVSAVSGAAVADDNGAVTGAAGGAVAGAVIGGPIGAVVGGVAGATVGGAASGPNRTVVVPAGPPCNTRTTQTSDNTGYSKTTQTTDCPD